MMQITTQNMLGAVQENQNKILKVNDNARCVLNKNMFDNGSKPKRSTKIHILKEIKAHSVLLDHDKW